MGNTIGYAIKLQGKFWWKAPASTSLQQFSALRKDAHVFPTKAAAVESFERPGFYPGRLKNPNVWAMRVVHLVQKPIEGTGRFVVRWRNRDGRLENYLNCEGQWGGFSDAVIHMTWDEAEDAIAEHGGITWSDMQLPGPAIIKLKARKPSPLGAYIQKTISKEFLTGRSPVTIPPIQTYVPPSRITAGPPPLTFRDFGDGELHLLPPKSWRYSIRKRHVVEYHTKELAEMARTSWDKADEFHVVQEGGKFVVRAKHPDYYKSYSQALSKAILARGGLALWKVTSEYV